MLPQDSGLHPLQCTSNWVVPARWHDTGKAGTDSPLAVHLQPPPSGSPGGPLACPLLLRLAYHAMVGYRHPCA